MADAQPIAIISREEAREHGVARYYTGLPCRYGHVCERSTSSKECVMCRRVRQKSRNTLPHVKEKRKAYDRKRWIEDMASISSKNHRYYAENADIINAQKREYYSNNYAKLKAARDEWVAANRHVVRHHNASRKRHIKQATPSWADMDAIRAVYEEAERLSAEVGIPFHVDHIVPLKGENICGLHVPWNLRPMPWRDNISKKNKLIEDVALAS